MKRPLISLCMIARDEELTLPRSLGSAKPWVDEMVVVDTGSSDASVEIATDLGARVFHHPWQRDFALARNQAMSHATGAWLLFLDADEELDQATAPAIRPSCEQAGDADRLHIEILHLAADGGHSLQVVPRLIRSEAGIRFVGRIHERLEGGVNRSLRAPVRLIHHGFAQAPEVMTAKAGRNLGLIRAWIEEDPQSLMAWCYLAQTLMASPATAQEALQAGLQARDLAREQSAAPHFWPRVYHPMLIALTHLGRHADLIALARQCQDHLPDYPDPLFSLTWTCYSLGRWEETCAAARRFLELQARWRSHPLDYPYGDNFSLGVVPRALVWWAEAATRLGRDEEAALAEAARKSWGEIR